MIFPRKGDVCPYIPPLKLHWDYSLPLKKALRFVYMPVKFIWWHGTECGNMPAS